MRDCVYEPRFWKTRKYCRGRIVCVSTNPYPALASSSATFSGGMRCCGGGPFGEFRLEVDDDKPAAGTQRGLQLREILRPVADVMVGVHHKDKVHGLGQIGAVRRRLHGHEIGQMLAFGPLTEIAHHVLLDIGGEDFAFRHALGNPGGEIAGAGTDVGDDHGRRQLQRLHGLLGLLPRIALGIVEFLGPFFGIVEAAMEGAVRWARVTGMIHMMVLSGHFWSCLRHCPSASEDEEHGDGRHPVFALM